MNEMVSKLLGILDGLENAHSKDCISRSKEVEKFLKLVTDTDLETICCNLFHYLSDEDIRSKDEQYKEHQNRELEKLKQLLNNNELSSAKNITFL